MNGIKQSTNLPVKLPTNCRVYTFQEKFNYNVGKHCLDKILLKGIYFVAKDQISGIKLYWSASMFDIFSQIKNFYESQFNDKIQKNLGTVTTKYGTNYSGYLGSAHEFGHSIGIPHPWEEEINRDTKGYIIDPQFGNDEQGSIMSYGGQKGPLIPNSFIRNRIKQKMMVAEAF